MYSLISPDDNLLIWGVVVVVVAVSITMNQRWKWANKLSGPVLCIFFGMLLANLGVIPFASPAYGVISSIVLPLAIPLMLFRSNLVQIFRESGVTLVIFLMASVASFLGTIILPLLFSGVDNIAEYSAMHVAAVIGGTANAVIMANTFAVPVDMLTALSIVGNIFVGLMVLFYSLMYNSGFFKKRFHYGFVPEENQDVAASITAAAAFWKSKSISLKDIAQAMALTFAIVGVSTVFTRAVTTMGLGFTMQQIFGNVFIVLTVLTTILATALPKYVGKIQGSDELGTILMMMWFVTIGSTANLAQIVQIGGLVFAAYSIVFVVSCVLVFSIGRRFKMELENMMCCITAAIGGPGTVAALCAAMGWRKWIVPGILMAMFGVIIGNFVGIAVGNMFGAAPFVG